MNIRKATTDDALEIAKVHIDSWKAAYRGIMPDSLLDGLEYDHRAKHFCQSIENGSDEIFVAENDDQIIGFLTIGPCRDQDADQKITSEILEIYRQPDYWRKGVGSLLFHHAAYVLLSRGYSAVLLWVLSENVESRLFYEKMDFKLDGGTKLKKYGTPLEIVRYRKELQCAEPGVSH